MKKTNKTKTPTNIRSKVFRSDFAQRVIRGGEAYLVGEHDELNAMFICDDGLRLLGLAPDDLRKFRLCVSIAPAVGARLVEIKRCCTLCDEVHYRTVGVPLSTFAALGKFLFLSFGPRRLKNWLHVYAWVEFKPLS